LSSLDPNSLSLDMKDSSRSCTSELLVQYSTLSDSVSNIWAVFGPQTYSLNLGQNQSALLAHQSYPSLWLEAENEQGCRTQSERITLLYPSQPNARATWVFQNDSLQFTALQMAEKHQWYMGITAGNWIDSSQSPQPVIALTDWPGEELAFSHRVSNDGLGCVSQWDSIATIPVNAISRTMVQMPVLSPNPVIAGHALNVPNEWAAVKWTTITGQSIELKSNDARMAPLQPGTYYLTLNKRDQSIILPVIVLEP
jgi:hypothetical protein